MRRLLHADLVGLRNALRRRENRRSLCFAVGVWLVFTASVLGGVSRLLLSTPVRRAMRDVPGEVGPALLALLVVLTLAFAGASSYAAVGRRLFAAATTELLLAAPLRRAVIVQHALVRAYLSALGVALTIGVPALILFAGRYRLHPIVLPMYVGLVATLLIPVVAWMLAFQVVVKRLSLRPRWRALLNLLVFAVGTGIALLIGAGVIMGQAEIEALVARMQQPALLPVGAALPGLFVAAGSLLGTSAGLSPIPVPDAATAVAGWLGSAWLIVGVVSAVSLGIAIRNVRVLLGPRH